MASQHGLDLIALLEPLALIGVGGQLRAAQNVTQTADRAHGDGNVAIGGLVDAVGRGDVGVGVADAAAHWRLMAVVEIGCQALQLQIEDGLQQGDLHAATLAGAAAADQTGQNTVHHVVAGKGVRHGDAQRRGRLVTIAVGVGQARHGLQQQVLAGLAFPRALCAVAGDGGIDQAGIQDTGALVVQTELGHNARAEILNEDVGLLHQRLHQLQVLGILQVGGKALLVAINGLKVHAVPIVDHVLQGQMAAAVTGLGVFHLDDPCTQIRQTQGGAGAGQILAEIQSDDAL